MNSCQVPLVPIHSAKAGLGQGRERVWGTGCPRASSPAPLRTRRRGEEGRWRTATRETAVKSRTGIIKNASRFNGHDPNMSHGRGQRRPWGIVLMSYAPHDFSMVNSAPCMRVNSSQSNGLGDRACSGIVSSVCRVAIGHHTADDALRLFDEAADGFIGYMLGDHFIFRGRRRASECMSENRRLGG